MDVEMAIEEPALSGPLLLRPAPDGPEAHVDDPRAAPFPFKPARGVALDVAPPADLGIGPDGDLPEVEEAGTRKTGILDPLPLFQEIAPGVSPPLSEVTPADSSFKSHMASLGSRLRFHVLIQEPPDEIDAGTTGMGKNW
jgi:hypothetical protein